MLRKKKLRMKIGTMVIIISILGTTFSSIFYFMTLNTSWFYELTTNQSENQSSCAISQNGRFAVVGSGNKNVYFFDTSDSNPLWIYRSESKVFCVDISSDGQYLVAGDENGNLYLFGNNNSIPIWTYSSDDSIGIVKISGDGNYIVMVNNGNLFLFERSSNIPLWTKPPEHPYSIVDISYSGNKIVSSIGGIISVYDNLSPIPSWQYDVGEEVTLALSLSQDGSTFAIGGQDCRIRIFNISESIPIHTFVSGSVRALSTTQTGTYFAAGCSDGFYLLNRSDILWEYPSDDGLRIDISLDGNYIIGSTRESQLYYFSKSSNEPIWIENVLDYTNQVCLSNDGRYVAAVTNYNFYLIDNNLPPIDELREIKLTVSLVSFWIFASVSVGITIMVITSWMLNKRKEKLRIEKEKIEKSITDAITTLDHEFKEWKKKDE